ncbi:ATP-binding protein [Jidongwangia harbinensis]|uniref:ATP-binding protein n=1 Tax=Jidongwangia harbinensis TaxID=2878561 RepID=UPI001CD969C6|nr:ATP-binding protein [Jidongwangia harbinensis]MCA2217997.1 ATP-binding protein [Jidongwangia harbinensis]
MARDWTALGFGVLTEGVKALVPPAAPLIKILESEKATFDKWRADKARQKAYADAVRTWGEHRGFGEASIEDGLTAAADILRQNGATVDVIAQCNLDHAAVARRVLAADVHPQQAAGKTAQEVCRHAIDEFYLRLLRDDRLMVLLDRAVQRELLQRTAALPESVADALAARAGLPPTLRSRLDDLRRDYELLGGRDRELTELDRFRATADSGYLLLTGDAGMGKTALLAGWIRRLEQAGAEVVYHFISGPHDTAGQQDVMASLVAQAAAAWRQPLAPGTLSATILELEDTWLRLLQGAPQNPVVIVIDGLDEAETAAWQVPKRLFPEPLLSGVHVVLSARSVAHRDWADFLGIDQPARLTVGKLDAAGVADVLDAAAAPRWVREPGATRILRERTDGDPFYLGLLIEAIRTGEISSAAALTRSPAKMEGYLENWWDDLTSRVDDKPAETLLSYLVVAEGPITRTELIDIDADDALSGVTFGKAFDRVRRFVVGRPATGLSLAHWRLRNFAEGMYSAQELRGLRTVLFDWCGRWREHRSRYALVSWPRQLLRLGETPAALLCDDEFQRARVEAADDAAGLLSDLEAALHALPGGRPDTVLLVRTAYELETTRDRWLRPDAVIAQARRGALAEAVRRLGMLGPQPVGQWTAAARLVLALSAAEANPENVRDLLGRMAPDVPGDSLQAVLHGRALARIGAGKEPELTMWFRHGPLPEVSDPDRALAALERAGGAPQYERGISGLPAPEGDEAGIYLAEEDGPWVVAYARDNRQEGGDWLSTYIDLHVANPYVLYRNRSLLSLLAAVACLPDADQALEYAQRITAGAYSGDTVRFAEFARLALHARRARTARLEQLRTTAVDAARQLHAGRDGADRWGHHTRRLAAHAEIAHRVLGDGDGGRRLLTEARTVPFGYAGYRSPACLAAAQAWTIVDPADVALRRFELDEALEAAHNVQEPSFAAVMTARVTTVARWWDESADDLEEIVAAFTSNPAATRFAPRLTIGEPFARRARVSHLSIDHITELTGPEEIADALGMPRPAVTLTGPGEVALPDTGFVPMVATHLSARVFAADLPNRRKAELLAALVPFAAADPTHLDQVLGRLFCVVPDLTDDAWQAVEQLVGQRTTVEPTGEWIQFLPD